MSTLPDGLLDTDDIVGSNSPGGELRLKLGDSVTGEGSDADASVWATDGYAARPSQPDDDGSARALFVVDGDEKMVIGTKDNRYVSKVGSLEPGDRMIYSKGSARMLLKDSDDSISLYTESADGSMMVNLHGSDGKLTASAGGAFMTMKNDEIVLAVNGGGAIRISKNGVTIRGGVIHADGGAVFLGNKVPLEINPFTAVRISSALGVVSAGVFAAPA